MAQPRTVNHQIPQNLSMYKLHTLQLLWLSPALILSDSLQQLLAMEELYIEVYTSESKIFDALRLEILKISDISFLYIPFYLCNKQLPITFDTFFQYI